MKKDNAELHQWTIEKVAEYCHLSPAEIDPNESFTSYGMDSVYALALIGDLEDRLGHPIDATAIWDHPSVNKLVTFVQSLEKSSKANSETEGA